MKTSQFNVMMPYKTATIIYNTFWDTCIMMPTDSNIKKLLDKGMNSVGINEIPQDLLSNKMVLPNDFDELKLFDQRLRTVNEDKTDFILTINPTLSCNFRCWYCYENHAGKRMMTQQDVKGIINLLRRIYSRKNIRNVQLSFFGGEPLLGFRNIIKKVIDAAQAISQKEGKTYSVSMTTNAYLLSKEVVDYLKEHFLQCLQITLDGNRDRHNKVRFLANGQGSYDVIVKNAKEAVRNGLKVVLRLNISEETDLDINQMLAEFNDIDNEHRAYLSFYVQKVWQSSPKVGMLVNNIIKDIRNSGYTCQLFDISYHTINNTCYADKKQHIIINPNGKIYGCSAKDFSESNIEGKLQSDGTIVFNATRRKRLQYSPLDNSACRSCKILPICMAGCKQKIAEASNSNKCIFDFTENQKQEYAEKFITERFS